VNAYPLPSLAIVPTLGRSQWVPVTAILSAIARSKILRPSTSETFDVADFMITEKQGCGLLVVGSANERDRLTQPESSMGASRTEDEVAV